MARIVGVNEFGLTVGEDHRLARHTDAEIELARELHDEGMSYAQLAEKFEVSKSTVAGWIKCRRRGQYPTRYKTLR